MGTLEDMDGQASHQRWKNLIKLFEVLQSIEDQGFLCFLMSLTLVISQLLTKQCQVARFKHNLVKRRTLKTEKNFSGSLILVPKIHGNLHLLVTNLVAKSKDTIHLPVVLVGAQSV